MSDQNAMWQTATAVVQAVCSITLLAWYVLAAHLARRLARRERTESFASLVRLCRDLGMEAKAKTGQHLDAARASEGDPVERLAAWKADMTIIYVCLDVVPHYEVRSPGFSQALTRLWFEVDVKTIPPGAVGDAPSLVAFLTRKFERICAEVDAMALLLAKPSVVATPTPRPGEEARPGLRARRAGASG